MTWLIATDESGNLGHDSRFFVMTAVIVKRIRELGPVFDAIPKKREEAKFYNSTETEIKNVLEKLSLADVHIITVVVDKYDHKSKYYGKNGNELYRMVLTELLDGAFKYVEDHDLYLFVDRSTFISLDTLRSIASGLAERYGCNLKRCEKATSHQNKCIQIADYVAGSYYAKLQYDDDRFVIVIEKKSIPAPKY